MIGTSRSVRVWAYPQPADLRKGYDGLFGLVKQGLRGDPLSGDLYVFVNRRRTATKILLWDGTGLCIFMKRLEENRFANLWVDDSSTRVELTTSELSLFVEGCTLVGRVKLSPAPLNLEGLIAKQNPGAISLARGSPPRQDTGH